jgi:hypothetical protein
MRADYVYTMKHGKKKHLKIALFMLKGDNVALVRAGVYIMNINAAG